jgi:cytochrome c-type biogenesis protein CcmH
MLLTTILTTALLAAAGPAAAREAADLAEDPALEARVTKLSAELRCLVCQNQTIADSHAGLAIDLKNQVREQLRAGRSDAEVIAFMVQRYGDFVLYRPPVKPTTAALWFGPFALLGIGAIVLAVVVRNQRRRAVPNPPMSDDERARAAALLGGDAPQARP